MTYKARFYHQLVLIPQNQIENFLLDVNDFVSKCNKISNPINNFEYQYQQKQLFFKYNKIFASELSFFQNIIDASCYQYKTNTIKNIINEQQYLFCLNALNELGLIYKLFYFGIIKTQINGFVNLFQQFMDCFINGVGKECWNIQNFQNPFVKKEKMFFYLQEYKKQKNKYDIKKAMAFENQYNLLKQG